MGELIDNQEEEERDKENSSLFRIFQHYIYSTILGQSNNRY
jgi:hypothetical protein